jgi:hypothetical protein
MGGGVDDEEPYEGPVLVAFSIDPGVDTGWSALKVPVGLLGSLGVARTLVRCRHLHGTIGRSGPSSGGAAGGAWSATDSQHVTDILQQARDVYTEWMPQWVDCAKCEATGEVYYGRKKDDIKIECPVCEGSGGEWDVDEPNDYRFVFVMEGFDLRMVSMDPALLAPVRVASIFMDRLVMNEGGGMTSSVFDDRLPPTLFQKVADAKGTITNDRMKRWGMYDPSSGEHARDADRHGILFLRKFASEVRLRKALWGMDPINGYVADETG